MKEINKNKEALFNYQILENFEAGIVLSGPEVKAIKNGQISLKGSYVSLDSKTNEAWLVNCHVSAYPPARNIQQDYDPLRKRKLLLHKRELASLLGKNKQKGLTIIPLAVYTRKRLIKISLGLARGKTKLDKREAIKKRESDREIKRTLKK
jgi:SsrA-binding protein